MSCKSAVSYKKVRYLIEGLCTTTAPIFTHINYISEIDVVYFLHRWKFITLKTFYVLPLEIITYLRLELY